MYTQCPHCRTAFRISARVLQQAAGRVRCNDCQHSFNALDSLSEDPPAANESPAGRPGAPGDGRKALLESIDELVGPDNVRIEDTGVEWRVLDDEGIDEGIESIEAEPETDAGSLEPVEQESFALPAIVDVDVDVDVDVERYDDNTPLSDDLDDDERPPLPEPPRRRAEDRIEARAPEFDERQADLALSEPEDWTDLLDEVGGDGAGMERPDAEQDPELADTDIRELSLAMDDDGTDVPGERPADHNIPSDIDTQFDLQALELGIEARGGIDAPREPPGERPTDAGAGDAEPFGAKSEADVAEIDLEATGAQPRIDADHIANRIAGDDPGNSGTVGAAADAEPDDPWSVDSLRRLDDANLAAPSADSTEFADDEDTDLENTGEFEQRIAAAARALAGGDEAGEGVAAGNGEFDAESPTGHPVPPQTEEELTINRLIDQDLLRLAQEENDFAAAPPRARKPRDDIPLVETIVMEGDRIRRVMDAEIPPDTARSATENRVFLKDIDSAALDGPAQDDAPAPVRDYRNYKAIGGSVVLALLLAAQVVHAYRDSLATHDAFRQTLGPVYRLLGAPLTPHWDLSSWRFQTTSGNTDAADEVLTISSRIVNQSNGPLPYPLLHVSLTDRWEEIVGSRMLEPAEYLSGDADPRGRVAQNGTFTALIAIASLPADATGFKLNVCYRESLGMVRCATGAFKH